MEFPAFQGIDTRALTKKLRVRGALNGFISTEEISEAEAVKRAKEFIFVGVDYVKEVTHKRIFAGTKKTSKALASFDLVRRTEVPQNARQLHHKAASCRLLTFRLSRSITG